MKTSIALALAAVVAALLAASVVASTKTTKLVATVADPFKISLTLNGKKVTSLKAGSYTIVVQDKASDHDFHLTGPGVDKLTSTGGKGTFTWKVKLRKGTYTYLCDPHASFMHGSFKVK